MYFFQLQAQLQLSATMMTLLVLSTTSPMGATPHHLQRAAPMPSLLEWPRSLSLKIPSTLASPTVNSSQTHVSTAVYTYWPIYCVAVATSMFIRVLGRDDSGEKAVKCLRIPGTLGPWNRSFDLLLMEFLVHVFCWAWNCGQLLISLGISFPKPFVNMKLESRHAYLENDRDRNQKYH